MARARPAAKPKRYHHGDLREALLEAGLAIIAETGIGELSLRQVARRAGVSHNAPYHHFADKSSLLAALAEQGFAALAGEIQVARAAAGGPRARLEAVGIGYVRFALRAPAQFRLMFRPELVVPDANPEVARSTTPVLDILIESVIDAQRAGEAPAGDPMPIVLTCWSAVHGLATLWLDGPLARNARRFAKPGPEALGASVVTTLVSVLAAAGRPRRRR